MEPISMGLMMALMGGGQALSALPQLGFGIADRAKANKLEKSLGDRPSYDIPQAAKDQLSLLKQMSGQQMPGYDLAKQDIGRATANTVGQAGQLASSSVGALTALNAAKGREMNMLSDLNQRAAMYQAQQQQNLAQGHGNMANWENLKWDWNQGRRWQEGMNRVDSLRASGAGNVMGATDTMGAGMTSAASAAGTMGMYQNMFPSYGGGNAPNNLPPYASYQNSPYQQPSFSMPSW